MNDFDTGFGADGDNVTRALDKYLAESKNKRFPVLDQQVVESLIESLELEKWLKQGNLAGDALTNFVDKYLRATTRLHHPGYLAHQVATPHPTGALGALIDAT